MKKKLVSMLLLAAMLAMVVAGCGGKNPQKKRPRSERKSDCYCLYSLDRYGALFVAKEKGMFKNRGVEVELQSIEGVGDRNRHW